MSIQDKQRIVIGMMDGFDMEYFENTEMSVLRSMANSGFFKEVSGVFPAAPDAAFFFTADHGMNYKKRCWDLKRVCEERGSPVRFVLSPERDYYVKHHRNFTGCSWIWLNNPDDIGKVTEILQGLEGVEEIISKEEAASRFHLKSERIGDLTVTGDQDTMFGEMETAYEDLPPTYRAHGSFYEMRLPLIIWNYHGELPPADEFRVNFDLTRMLYR